MKITFSTVIYNQAWKWKKEFINSINEQSEKNFEILIINDGVEKKNIEQLSGQLSRHCIIVNIDRGLSISQVRIKMLKTLKDNGTDLAILGDFDDTFEKNRVKKFAENYDNQYDFFYNQLKKEDGNNVFSEIPLEIEKINPILECNFLGLSTTAINMNNISNEFIDSLENVSTNVFDWYLYAKMLIEGKKGKKIDGTYTIYRQQPCNIAGINKDDVKSIRKEIDVKVEQYRLLKSKSKIIEDLYNKYIMLQNKKIDSFTPFLNENKAGYWWSNLKLIKEED